jgi:hypothetical protein
MHVLLVHCTVIRLPGLGFKDEQTTRSQTPAHPPSSKLSDPILRKPEMHSICQRAIMQHMQRDEKVV